MSNNDPSSETPTEYRTPRGANGAATRPGAEGGFAPGDVIAERYRLVRMLGQGGMGVVWVARSLVLGVDVAIKLIRAGVAGPDVTERMAREAQATATLGHPALVRVFDFGVTASGEPFLVMELVQGETLAAMLRREQRLSAVHAAQVLLPLADGLRCAHERGIVHRDVKPENVFIARDALGRVQPKLLDFGIAKLEHQPSAGRLTQMGAVLGSPEFMSPEQARGDHDTDARTDVWSLCVMLYEMVTGTVPFKDQNYNALMQAILHERPVPTTQYAAGDKDLWLVIERGLEKSKEERWASVTELGEALALWLYERGIKDDLAGNSIKALWLGGNAPAVNSEAPDPARSFPTLAKRVRPTARRKLRQLRQRFLRVSTRAAAVALLAAVAGALFSSRKGDERAEAEPVRNAAGHAITAASGAPIAPTVSRRIVLTPEPAPSVVPIAEIPPEGSARKPLVQQPARRQPPRRTPPPTPNKSIRDFGF